MTVWRGTILGVLAVCIMACGALPVFAQSDRPDSRSIEAADLQMSLPGGWEAEQPSSGMRAAQIKIPGAAGPGQLLVFYFGEGGGGSTEDNLQRWISQVSPAPGTEVQRQSLEANGLLVTWIDVSGTINPSTMGTGPQSPVEGQRLFGAVVEGPGGPWFLKATGPESTMAMERDKFEQLLRGLRKAPNT